MCDCNQEEKRLISEVFSDFNYYLAQLKDYECVVNRPCPKNLSTKPPQSNIVLRFEDIKSRIYKELEELLYED